MPSRSKGLHEKIPKNLLLSMEGYFPKEKKLENVRILYLLEGQSTSLDIEGSSVCQGTNKISSLLFIGFYIFRNKYINIERFILKIEYRAGMQLRLICFDESNIHHTSIY